MQRRRGGNGRCGVVRNDIDIKGRRQRGDPAHARDTAAQPDTGPQIAHRVRRQKLQEMTRGIEPFARGNGDGGRGLNAGHRGRGVGADRVFQKQRRDRTDAAT